MQRTILWAAAVGVVLGASAAAPADEIRINFDNVDGVSTSLWYGRNGTAAQEAFGGSNTGAEIRTYLTMPNANDDYRVALYRPNLPANFADATVHSATFTVSEAFFNAGAITNVRLHRVNVPGDAITWDPGTGTRGTRFTTPQDGAQRFWADFDVAGNSGIDWAGNVQAGPWNGGSATDFHTTAMADFIDAQTVAGGQFTTWNVTTLAQNWANGTWENDGFAIQTFDGASANTSGYQLRSDGTSRGLVIEYTPIPEPASLGLIGAAGLTLLRRRRNEMR